MITHHRPEPSLPGRVVVLGAKGFVASDLLGHLATLGVATEAVGAAQVDLRSPDSVTALAEILKPDDALVFVSALTPDRGRDIATLMANLAMAQHVCAAIEASPCNHIVYVGSDAVYHDDAHPVRENSCCDPSSFHGLMHLARERMLLPTTKKAGIPLFILRPSLLFGARDTHNGYGPNRFLRTAMTERKISLFGGGEEKRDHVAIRDLSRLIGLALRHRSEGILNGATGTSTSFYDIADAIARRVGGGAEVVTTARQNPITHRHFDVTRTLEAFPEFRYTPLDEALDAMVAEARTLAVGASR